MDLHRSICQKRESGCKTCAIGNLSQPFMTFLSYAHLVFLTTSCLIQPFYLFTIPSTDNSYWDELDSKLRGGSLSKEFGTKNAAEIFDHLGWEKPIPKTSDNSTSDMEAVPTQATRLLNKKRKLMEN